MRSVQAIKRKYGANAFRTWGKRGGNPVLIAQGRGDKIIIRRRKKA
jgi:hypothetical protein